MKKILALGLAIVLALALAACGEDDGRAADGAIEIGDKLFITQVNEIKVNYEDYLGETVRLEGIYSAYDYDDDMLHYVTRNGPGCCGDDGVVGFEVAGYEGDWPEQNDWVAVEGTLEQYEAFNWYYLRLNVTSIEVMEERGQEYVDL